MWLASLQAMEGPRIAMPITGAQLPGKPPQCAFRGCMDSSSRRAHPPPGPSPRRDRAGEGRPGIEPAPLARSLLSSRSQHSRHLFPPQKLPPPSEGGSSDSPTGMSYTCEDSTATQTQYTKPAMEHPQVVLAIPHRSPALVNRRHAFLLV